MMRAANGKLYGLADNGGGGNGAMFEFDPSTNVYTVKNIFTGSNGAFPFLNALTQAHFAVRKDQTITFGPLAGRKQSDVPFTISATATSNLPVQFTAISDKVTINENEVTVVKAGSVTIKADQPGNANFNPAPTVEQVFCIEPARPTLNVTGEGTTSVLLNSSSNSGNQWFLDGIAIPNAINTTLTPPANGVYKVQVNIDGCISEFSVELDFCFKPATPVITLTGQDTDNVMLTSSSVSGNQWFLNDTAIPNATGRTLNPTSAGVYKVQVTIDGCVSEFSADLPLITTGNYETPFAQPISFYPNPAEDKLTIVIPDNTGSRVSVYDVSGKCMENFNTLEEVSVVDVGGYAAGIYFLQVSNGYGQQHGRFMKK